MTWHFDCYLCARCSFRFLGSGCSICFCIQPCCWFLEIPMHKWTFCRTHPGRLWHCMWYQSNPKLLSLSIMLFNNMISERKFSVMNSIIRLPPGAFPCNDCKSQIRHKSGLKWAVSLVITDDHNNIHIRMSMHRLKPWGLYKKTKSNNPIEKSHKGDVFREADIAPDDLEIDHQCFQC